MERATNSSLILYTTEDGLTKIEATFDRDTVWLSIDQMADLFQRNKSTISRHIGNIYKEGELDKAATVAKFATVQMEGERQVERQIEYYNLDVIISVGYRVKSQRGVQFRMWATAILKEFMKKGFVLDDDRLKNLGGGNYFDELLARIQDIRSSEKVFWRKVLEIYATSIDYDPKAESTVLFFKQVQNKMHWAAHQHTAAEVMISKRNQEREQYKLVGEQAEFLKDFADEKIYWGNFDLRDYGEDLEYARSSLDGRKSNRYYLCFYTVLDYVVPYAAQSSVTLISDFEDSIVNNIYSQEQKYRIKAIHVSVFPLKSTSAILLFIEDGVKRYRKFYRSLRKLPNDDQLAAINYLVFSYTENVFMNPTTHKELRKNDLFMDMCRKSTDFRSHTPFPLDDPLEAAVKEFSLSKRNEIPNLLSREYAL